MDGEQIPTIPHSTFISPGFIFGNANSDQPTENSSGRSYGASASQSRNNRACRDESSETRNREGTDTDKPAQRATQHDSGARARNDTLWSFARLSMAEIFGPDVLCHEEGNVCVAKS